MFESSVNSEGIETRIESKSMSGGFESSVNSEGIETRYKKNVMEECLRAV